LPTFGKREIVTDDPHWNANWVMFLMIIIPLNFLQVYLNRQKKIEKIAEARKFENLGQIRLELRRWEAFLVRKIL
jgi:hypothetical protein